MIRGIDVSSNNGRVDWYKVLEDGISFAMIRGGYGKDNRNQDDKYFSYNVGMCEQLGIPYGIYLYSYALNGSDVISEANHMIRLLGDHKPKLGLWLDMEDADGYKKRHDFLPSKHKMELTSFCHTWIREVKKNQNITDVVGVYASYSWFKDIIGREYDHIWLAQWSKKNSISYDIWQHSNKGSCLGVNGRVDLDYMQEKRFNEFVGVDQTKIVYYPKYTGFTISIAYALQSLGCDGSFEHRKKIAHANGIISYKGTSAQNTRLLKLLKEGKLVKE